MMKFEGKYVTYKLRTSKANKNDKDPPQNYGGLKNYIENEVNQHNLPSKLNGQKTKV